MFALTVFAPQRVHLRTNIGELYHSWNRTHAIEMHLVVVGTHRGVQQAGPDNVASQVRHRRGLAIIAVDSILAFAWRFVAPVAKLVAAPTNLHDDSCRIFTPNS